MDRIGEFLTLCDGAAFGRRIWCDQKGRYSVDGQEGISDFFFHQKSRTLDNLYIYLRCKHCKTRNIRCPVKVKIKSSSGEIVTMRNLHNHLPEFDGHGLVVRTARANWLRALRKNPRESPMNAVLNERRRLPIEIAAQIKPVSHVTTARRHVTAAGKLAQVRSLQELLEFIDDNGIPEFANAGKGRRLLYIHKLKDDSAVPVINRNLDLISKVTNPHPPHTPRSPEPREQYLEVPLDRGEQESSARSIKVKGVDISGTWELLDSGLITPTDFIDLVKLKVGNAASPQLDIRAEEASESDHCPRPPEVNIANRILQHDHDYMLPTCIYDGDHSYTRPPE